METEQYRKLCEEYCRQREERHKEFSSYLVSAPNEFVKAKMEVFQLDESILDKVFPIIICGIKQHVFLHPKKTIDLSIVEVGPYTHYVQPGSLEHAKDLFGVPNKVHQITRKEGMFCECNNRWKAQMNDIRTLDTSKGVVFNELEGNQRTALHHASLSLLYGYVDESSVARQPYKQVADYLLGRLDKLPVFVGNDLIVCPDETVEFKGYAAVYFNNVVVIGNGQVNLGNYTKLHAYQIRHV